MTHIRISCLIAFAMAGIASAGSSLAVGADTSSAALRVAQAQPATAAPEKKPATTPGKAEDPHAMGMHMQQMGKHMQEMGMGMEHKGMQMDKSGSTMGMDMMDMEEMDKAMTDMNEAMENHVVSDPSRAQHQPK